MNLFLQLDGRFYAVAGQPRDISIAMAFNGSQPNTYGVPRAVSQAFEGGGFVGDVRRGGSCNFEQYTLIPHCNGTHTECIGHVAEARIAVHEVLRDSLFPATLVSVEPRPALGHAETYRPEAEPGDRFLTRADLEAALDAVPDAWLEALVIRTLPNPAGKQHRDYMADAPAFFSLEAMTYLRQRGVKHLLVDLPSVDRLFDEGHLDNHHIFWAMEPDSHAVDPARMSLATITEMVFVPDELADGPYLLELQIAAWLSDAAPSRPRLFEVLPVEANG